jgi:HSP20 family protein
MVETTGTAHGDWWPYLSGPFRNLGSRIHDFFSPQADAATTEDAYHIELELPGVKEEDIDISLHDGVLMVKGEKRSEREEKGKSYYFSERAYGAFQRSFRLPGDVNSERIDANFENGVLTVILPKRDLAEDKTTRIAINKN